MRVALMLIVLLGGCVESHSARRVMCDDPPELPGGVTLQRWDGPPASGRLWACEACANLEAEVLGRADDLGCAGLTYDTSWCLPNEDADGRHACHWPPLLEIVGQIEAAATCAEVRDAAADLECVRGPGHWW